MLDLFNTKTRKIEHFKTAGRSKEVTLYTCGPTVYQYAHLGNLRAYIFEDILKRVLISDGYKVNHIMNITDVGHLTSDADIGEDKIVKEAQKKNKKARDIALFYERAFKKDLGLLNILPPTKYVRATEHIKEQIELIIELEKKGYTYKTDDGIYFDTSKFKHYGILATANIKGIKEGARVKKGQKKNPTDFALWKLSPAGIKGVKRQLEWNSPWGVGFPGWHLECSAMSMKYLGSTIDIHCGGIDHIQIHHTNEIAQSEAATGKEFVRYWLHCNFLMMKGNNKRMGKSQGNAITTKSIINKGYSPLDFRYFILTSHYRSPLNFSLDAMDASRKSRLAIVEYYKKAEKGKKQKEKERIMNMLRKDLHTPSALAGLWKLIRRNTATRDLIKSLDEVFGLGIVKSSKEKVSLPENVKRLLARRESYRKNEKWKEADKIRQILKKKGWEVRDGEKSYIVHKL